MSSVKVIHGRFWQILRPITGDISRLDFINEHNKSNTELCRCAYMQNNELLVSDHSPFSSRSRHFSRVPLTSRFSRTLSLYKRARRLHPFAYPQYAFPNIFFDSSTVTIVMQRPDSIADEIRNLIPREKWILYFYSIIVSINVRICLYHSF